MALTVAQLVVEVGADVRGAMSGLGQVQTRINRLVGGVRSAAMSLAPVGVALGAIGAVGLRAFTGYENAMAELIARTGLAGDELERVRELTFDMGRTTQFSATQAAEAMLQLVASGQSVNEAMSTLPQVLTLAAISGLDLGTTADALTDVLQMFNLEVQDSAAAVNVLAAAEGASSATVALLVEGLANVGPVARQMGLDIETTAAALAVLSENGIKGAEAGTALKSMLLNMTRPTDDVQAAWERLGTSFYDAQGNMRPLPDILADIKAGLADMTPQEANETLKALAGSYGLVAMNALLGDLSITDMLDAMGNQASAAEIAAAKTDTLSSSAQRLKSSLEVLLIKNLQSLVENGLRPLIDVLTGVVGLLIMWADENPQVAQTVVGLAAGIVVLTTTLTALSAVLSITSSGFALLSPPVLMVAGVLALVVGIVRAVETNFLGLGDRVREVRDAFGEGGLTGTLKGLGLALLAIPRTIAEVFVDTSQIQAWVGVWENLKTIIGALPGFIVGVLSDATVSVVNAVPTALEAAVCLGRAIFDGIVNVLRSLPAKLVQMINDAIPNEIDLGSVRHTFDLPGILGGPQTVDVKFGKIDLPDNPLPIPAFAAGGIVTRPTLALVGEREPEAIIPLSRLERGGGEGRGIVITGDVHVHGVQDVQTLLRELERAAARRDSRLTVPRGVS